MLYFKLLYVILNTEREVSILLYHLSTIKGLEILIPKVPETAISGLEDTSIKRVCFSDSIEGCLSALQDIPRKYYVYSPCEEVVPYYPRVDEVRDAKYTHEVWVTKNVKVKCLGIIESWGPEGYKNHNSGRGRVAVLKYFYRWLDTLK